MPEFRKDPLSSEWVIFAPERRRRPQDFKVSRETAATESPFIYGNEHMTPPEVYACRLDGSAPNKPGWKVRVVPNRYPALRVEGDLNKDAWGLYDHINGVGAHEVIIETPDASLPLEAQPVGDIVHVLEAFKARVVDLSRDSRLRYIQLFKNHGPLAGASLQHAHSQLIGTPVLPSRIKNKLECCRLYYTQKERNIFEDIIQQEKRTRDRVVYENNSFFVFCPYASRMPFEMAILPKRQSPDFHSCDIHEFSQLADALKASLLRLNYSLDNPCYNLILHTAPLRWSKKNLSNMVSEDFRWHIEILPRLTAHAGFEFGTGSFINPILPEEAAKHMRNVRLP